jgi:hypothetical protein
MYFYLEMSKSFFLRKTFIRIIINIAIETIKQKKKEENKK